MIISFIKCGMKTVEVCEWISNDIPHFTGHVITYPCLNLNQSMLVKGPHVCSGPNKVECRYNAVTSVMILHSTLQWQWQDVSQTSDSQKPPHTSPSRTSHRVSFMMILEKIDIVITAPHYITRRKTLALKQIPILWYLDVYFVHLIIFCHAMVC